MSPTLRSGSKNEAALCEALTRSYLLYYSSVILLLTFTYREKPPTPPCYNSDRQPPSFRESLSMLWYDKHFVIFAQSYGIYFGLFVTFSILVNPLMTAKYTEVSRTFLVDTMYFSQYQ